MTIIQKLIKNLTKKYNFQSLISLKVLQIRGFNPIGILSFLMVFSGLFFISSSLINKKNVKDSNNFKEVVRTNEFSNFINYISSKINSPYEEINYIIKNNDTVEKILKKFKIKDDDINKISLQLKKKN